MSYKLFELGQNSEIRLFQEKSQHCYIDLFTRSDQRQLSYYIVVYLNIVLCTRENGLILYSISNIYNSTEQIHK